MFLKRMKENEREWRSLKLQIEAANKTCTGNCSRLSLRVFDSQHSSGFRCALCCTVHEVCCHGQTYVSEPFKQVACLDPDFCILSLYLLKSTCQGVSKCPVARPRKYLKGFTWLHDWQGKFQNNAIYKAAFHS